MEKATYTLTRAQELIGISASELAKALGPDIHPQTIGEAVAGVSRMLGVDIRKDDLYTTPYYGNGLSRNSQRNWRRYRLTSKGRELVEGQLRTMGRL
jgi:hypothetical protein